jgi:glycosyltransferase involved in cell wall biosynthesis
LHNSAPFLPVVAFQHFISGFRSERAPVRIVQLSTMRDYYGGEVCLVNLARGLLARGHEVTCIVRPDGWLASVLPRHGVPTRELPLVDWYEPVSIARLGAWLRRERVDIVHTHTPRDWFIAATATVGGPALNVATRHLLRPVTHPGLKRPFLRRLSAMIAVSDAVRRGVETARLVAPGCLATIPNGVALSGPGQRLGPLRAREQLGPEDLVVGCVARLSPEKGVADLLRAVARLRPRWPRLTVLIVGDAPVASGHPQELRRLAVSLGLGSAVRFCGYQPDAGNLCAEFDIQVVCSLAEPCGLATLEAMAQGRPVVATASGGSPELVDDGIEGFLVPPRDPERLANRLDCLLDSPGLRREMGRRGRDRAQRDFGLDLMVERTEAVYRLALDGAVS